MALDGKRIVLGVTGSIAAYKAVALARLLHDAGAEVTPVLSRGAARFVGPLTFTTVAGRRCIVDLWAASDAGEVGHVELAHAADVLVIAPCSADTLARLVEGRADDPLASIALSCTAPRLCAPAMESGMWNNPATQHNVQVLSERGWTMVWPESGFLASGRSGVGRMAEPETIVTAVRQALTRQDLAGQHVLVTAGPTREAFDPARFISNPSTGKMGYALAAAALLRGASVHLISGPTALAPPSGVEVTHIITTDELLEAARKALPPATILLMAAAPADWRPTQFSPEKLKKTAPEQQFTLALENTPDVLAALAARREGRFVVGFAAETGNLVAHGSDKLRRKDLDMLVANIIGQADSGFAADTNRAVLLFRDGANVPLPLLSKDVLAHRILDHIVSMIGRSGAKNHPVALK